MIAGMKAASKSLVVEGDRLGHSIKVDAGWVGQYGDGYEKLYLTVKAINMDGEDETVVIALGGDDIWRLVSSIAACMAEVR